MEQDILVGTLVQVNEKTESYLRQIIPYGFESFAFTFGHNIAAKRDPVEFAEKIMPILEEANVKVGAISIFGNPLKDDEKAEQTRKDLNRLVECAHLFKTDVVTGFTGRVPGVSVPESIPRFKEVWTPIVEKAGALGVKVGFENCPMGGTWGSGDFNIAFNPSAWELMFEAIPLPNIGLEWEPCHQMTQLIDPIQQIRQWGKRFIHIHGKDATIRHDLLDKYGFMSPEKFVWHRTPGFGDSNWKDIFTELRMVGFKGSIDIEGWHDPVYRGDLEMTGQVYGLNYLKDCRGGKLVPNPA